MEGREVVNCIRAEQRDEMPLVGRHLNPGKHQEGLADGLSDDRPHIVDGVVIGYPEDRDAICDGFTDIVRRVARWSGAIWSHVYVKICTNEARARHGIPCAT